MINKNIYLTLIAAALLVGSCGKGGDFTPGPTLNPGDLPVITSPADSSVFVLKEATGNDVFGPFAWTEADFGFRAAVTYTLELDVAGNNFAAPVTIGTSNSLSLSVTNTKVNNILFGAKGLPGEEPSDVEVRLACKIHPDVPVVYSQPISLRITPYTVVVVYPQLQVPGSYQGWNPANNNTVIFSAKSDGRFEGYVYFPDPGAEFKYTDGPSWDTNYGDTGADGTLNKGGDNIKLTDAGLYRLNADLNALTHANLKTDWGLIGSATPTGWDSDTDMIYDAATNSSSVTSTS
ncbi:MAG: SusE domain-containing protein [Saprospirales bacterium]|nr:SusE domain-containing protein [Saprospirales bacterium]